MFTIYNNGSVGFRSTADNLYNLKNIDESSESRFKPDEGLINDFSNKKKDDALNAYKKMANLDISEPVYHVKDIMSKEVITIDVNARLEEAYALLKEEGIGQIPITSYGKKIVGLLSQKFILKLIMEDLENHESVLNKKVEDLFLPDMITTDPISDIRRVAKVMVDFKLEAIPVVDEEDILLGIISKTDLIKAISQLPKLQLWS
ncbi:MAG: CBS domain-containing protein [Arcobacteraceae bacterium]|nr:CBS domain-containing protein [Arcobacteraceae bacterium]